MVSQLDMFDQTPIEADSRPVSPDGTYTTQFAKVRAYMASVGRLDTVTAVMRFNCLRLGAIVHKLKRRDGWQIRTAGKSDGWDKVWAMYIVEKVGVCE